jgi:hypothetical protein
MFWSAERGAKRLYEWKAAGRAVEGFMKFDLNQDSFIPVEEVLRVQEAGASTRAGGR